MASIAILAPRLRMAVAPVQRIPGVIVQRLGGSQRCAVNSVASGWRNSQAALYMVVGTDLQNPKFHKQALLVAALPQANDLPPGQPALSLVTLAVPVCHRTIVASSNLGPGPGAQDGHHVAPGARRRRLPDQVRTPADHGADQPAQAGEDARVPQPEPDQERAQAASQEAGQGEAST